MQPVVRLCRRLMRPGVKGNDTLTDQYMLQLGGPVQKPDARCQDAPFHCGPEIVRDGQRGTGAHSLICFSRCSGHHCENLTLNQRLGKVGPGDGRARRNSWEKPFPSLGDRLAESSVARPAGAAEGGLKPVSCVDCRGAGSQPRLGRGHGGSRRRHPRPPRGRAGPTAAATKDGPSRLLTG